MRYNAGNAVLSAPRALNISLAGAKPMPRPDPITVTVGERFNALTIVAILPGKRRLPRCLCRCACGNELRVEPFNLINGLKQSCGCQWRSRAANANKIHGKRGTTIYVAWKNMRSRCYNSKRLDFKNYGGRGITVCTEWKESFEAFYAAMGDPPEGTSLDRIDNEGNYEPGNCRWATRAQQQSNTRRSRRP